MRRLGVREVCAKSIARGARTAYRWGRITGPSRGSEQRGCPTHTPAHTGDELGFTYTSDSVGERRPSELSARDLPPAALVEPVKAGDTSGRSGRSRVDPLRDSTPPMKLLFLDACADGGLDE